MMRLRHGCLCFLILLATFTTLISIDCALCIEGDAGNDSDEAKLIVSTIEGSLVVLRKWDGKILLNLKGKALIEGFNHMKDKYELVIGTSKEHVQFRKLIDDNHDNQDKHITTSLKQLTTHGYEFGSDLVSLSSHKDTLHLIDLHKHHVRSLTTFNIENDHTSHELAIKYAGPNYSNQEENVVDELARVREDTLPSDNSGKSEKVQPSIEQPQSSRFSLMQRSYRISVFNMEENKELGRLNYVTFPQLEDASYTDDENSYFFSIHSNKLASVNVLQNRLNWIVRLDSHLYSLGVLHNITKVKVKRLPVNFVTERIMQEILLRVENKQDLELLNSVEFIRNNIRNVEILSESNGVKLLFDSPTKRNKCGNELTENQACNNGIIAAESVDGVGDSMVEVALPAHLNRTTSYDENSVSKLKNEIELRADGNVMNPEKILSLYESLVVFMVECKRKFLKYVPVSEAQLDAFINYSAMATFGFSLIYACGKSYNVCERQLVSLIENIRQESSFVENGSNVKYLNMEFHTSDHLHDTIPSSKEGVVVADHHTEHTVFQGKYKNKSVAIRRYENLVENGVEQLHKPCPAFNRELSVLNSIPFNKHLAKLVGTENGVRYSYVITELHHYNLERFFQHSNSLQHSIDMNTKINMIYQILKGIKHLHSNGFAHGALRPRNILIDVTNQSKQFRIVVAKFSQCQHLDDESLATVSSSNGINPSVGCSHTRSKNVVCTSKDYFNVNRPPLTNALKHTSRDLYDFGKLVAYVVFNGNPPRCFRPDLISNNVISAQLESALLEHAQCFAEEVVDLLKNCFSLSKSNPANHRTSAAALVNHPLFWSYDKKGLFISEVSNYIDHFPAGNSTVKSLERLSCSALKGSWVDMITNDIVKDVTRHRIYRGDSIKDLLRIIRNKRNHFNDTITDVSSKFKSHDHLTRYFFEKFPKLLIHVYNVFKDPRTKKSLTLNSFFVEEKK